MIRSPWFLISWRNLAPNTCIRHITLLKNGRKKLGYLGRVEAFDLVAGSLGSKGNFSDEDSVFCLVRGLGTGKLYQIISFKLPIYIHVGLYIL